MYVYIYIYIYMYVCIHTHTHTHKHIIFLLKESMYSYCSSMYSKCCLCILIVRPCILNVVYVFSLFVHIF